MQREADDYADFVAHPRYGRGPRFTEVRVGEVKNGCRLTTYLSGERIAGTAVEADLDRQVFSPVPVLYYFDLKRECVGCGRRFLFFAEEQKHWYETLGFVLDADCVRCVDCRKRMQGIERQRLRHEELLHRDARTVEENVEWAECLVALIEKGLFHARQTERVRMLLNGIAADGDESLGLRCAVVWQRLIEIEALRARDEGMKP